MAAQILFLEHIMALRKIAISVGEELDRYLTTRLPVGGNVSGALNTLAQRYAEIVSLSLPRFSLNEWMMLFDALGSTYNPWYLDELTLPEIVRMAVERYGLGDKWRLDGSAFALRLESLNFCESVAVRDAADRFWSGSGDPGVRNADRVVQVVGAGSLRRT